MKILKQFGIGAIVGVSLAILFIFIPFSKIALPIKPALIVLFIIVFILWVYACIITRNINQLIEANLDGDAEDEAEGILNRKFYDYSFCMNVSSILAMLGLAIAMIEVDLVLIAIGVLMALISSIMPVQMMKLMRKAYPERDIPEAGEKDFSKKLLQSSDDGEKFIMLQGLYRAFNFSNGAFLFSIVGITLYSVFTEDSQLFSIVIIAIILLMTNIMYIVTIRNK